jgi:molybdopterin-binding protein
MKYGARNQFTGHVIEIKKGKLMCQVTLRVPTETLVTSVMTLDSLKHLGVKKGRKLTAIVKAVNVMLVKED